MTLLSGVVACGGRYFRIPNFICKHKEMSMSQLHCKHLGKLWLCYYYTMPSSLLVFSSAIFSRNVLRSALKPFYNGKLVVVLYEIKMLMFAVVVLESTGNH